MQDVDELLAVQPAVETSASPTEEKPRVRLEVRRHRYLLRRLAPAGLILLLGITTIAVRLQLKDWRGVEPVVTALVPVAPKRVVVPVTTVATPVRPFAKSFLAPLVRPDIHPLRPTPTAKSPAIILFSSQRPRDLIDLPDHPKLAASLAKREIEQEASRRREEQVENATIQSRQPQLERDRAANARLIRIQEAIDNADRERISFHKELARILRTKPVKPGGLIKELIERHDAEAEPEIAQAVSIASSRPAVTRYTRKQRVTMLRSLGVPESVILQEFVDAEKRQLASRKGPRTLDEAIVRASKQLLAIPPVPPDAVAGKSTQAGQRTPERPQ